MHPLLPCNVACLGIAIIFYLWRDLYRPGLKPPLPKNIHERVAYMLWVAASRLK